MDVQLQITESSIGIILIAITNDSISSVLINDSYELALKAIKQNSKFIRSKSYDNKHNEIVSKTLAIINGANYSVPIKMSGTDFQKNVWNAIRTIPYGETCTYADIGRKINSKTFRAIGTACSKNPLAILVTCHRVINSNNTIGGYRWGADLKGKLLTREKL